MGEFADMEINACIDDVWESCSGRAPVRTRPAEAVRVEPVARQPRWTTLDPDTHEPLLDCPPCGSDMVEIMAVEGEPFRGYCHECCGEGPRMPTVAEAVQAWNALERGREVQRRAYNEIVMLARQRNQERGK